MVACGPPGLKGDTNILYRNNGDGTFTDVSEKAGITNVTGTFGLGVLVADFDNDGWPDIYVANDSQPSLLYQNQNDWTFKYIVIESVFSLSADGKPQAVMVFSAADYDGDGNLDVVKTNFAGDTHSLYHNLCKAFFEDTTYSAHLGLNTRFLGWGCGFIDMDNDTWPDILVCNGHVYPEVEQLRTEAGYEETKLLYKNLGNGDFADVTESGGPGITVPNASRGCAFGDFDNDGDMDVAVNTNNGYPQLLRCDSKLKNNWIKIRTIGVKTNRSGIGARVVVTSQAPEDKKPRVQTDEVRSGGGYISQSDLRIHFGLGKAEKVAKTEVRWPSGQIDTVKDVAANRLLYIKEGAGVVRTVEAAALRKAK